MARTIRALLSDAAKGTLGADLCFGSWRGRPYVRRKPKHRAPWTQPQLASRTFMAWLCRAWKTLTPTQRLNWMLNAIQFNLPGYQFFLKYNMERWTHLKHPSAQCPATEAPPNASYNTRTTAVGRHFCQVNIDVGNTDARWFIALYRSTGPFYPQTPKLLVAAAAGIKNQLVPLVDNTAIPGVNYRYEFSIGTLTGNRYLSVSSDLLTALP